MCKPWFLVDKVVSATKQDLFKTFNIFARASFFWQSQWKVSTKNWCHPHFLVFNKVSNIRQHNFETNKGLIFDYALLLFQNNLRYIYSIKLYIEMTKSRSSASSVVVSSIFVILLVNGAIFIKCYFCCKSC